MKKIAAILSLVLLLAACSAPEPVPTPLPFVEDSGTTLYFPFMARPAWPVCPNGRDVDRIGVAWFARTKGWESELEGLCGSHWYASNQTINNVTEHSDRWAVVHCLSSISVLTPEPDALAYSGYLIVGNEPNDAPNWQQCNASSTQMGRLLYDVYQKSPNAKVLFPGIIVQYESGNNFSPDYIVDALNVAASYMGMPAVLDYVEAVAIHVYDRYDVSVVTKVEWTRDSLDASGWGDLKIAVTEMGVLPGNDNRQTMSDLVLQCLSSEAIFCMGYTNRYPQSSCAFIVHGTRDTLSECGLGWFDGLSRYYE